MPYTTIITIAQAAKKLKEYKEMHENKEGLAISFWTSLTGLVVAGLSALAIFMCRGNDFVVLPILIATPIFFGLQVSSITAGLSEYRSKSGKAALTISIIAVFLAIGMAYFRPGRGILFELLMPLLFFAVPITGIVAGAAAIDVKNGKTRTLKPMLIIWFIAYVFTSWPLTQMVFKSRDLAFIKLFALLFGPWASFITRLGDLHGSIDFFLIILCTGIGLTVALVAVSIMAIRAKRPRRAAVLLILFASLLLSWFGIGTIALLD